MKHYCLTVDEIAHILEWRESGKDLPAAVAEVVALAQAYTTCMVCHTYLFARILERRRDSPEDLLSKIAQIYSLEEDLFFQIQEADQDFIECLVRDIRDQQGSLDDALISVQNAQSDHDYGKPIRR